MELCFFFLFSLLFFSFPLSFILLLLFLNCLFLLVIFKCFFLLLKFLNNIFCKIFLILFHCHSNGGYHFNACRDIFLDDIHALLGSLHNLFDNEIIHIFRVACGLRGVMIQVSQLSKFLLIRGEDTSPRESWDDGGTSKSLLCCLQDKEKIPSSMKTWATRRCCATALTSCFRWANNKLSSGWDQWVVPAGRKVM